MHHFFPQKKYEKRRDKAEPREQLEVCNGWRIRSRMQRSIEETTGSMNGKEDLPEQKYDKCSAKEKKYIKKN